MTIKLTLLIKLLFTTSLCYMIEKQLHDTKIKQSSKETHQNIYYLNK